MKSLRPAKSEAKSHSRSEKRLRRAVAARGREHGESASLLRSQAHRRGPGRLSRRSIQFGMALAPRLPHRLRRFRVVTG
jgi:hypothetical protein